MTEGPGMARSPAPLLVLPLLLLGCAAQPNNEPATNDTVDDLAYAFMSRLTDAYTEPIAALQRQVSALALQCAPPPAPQCDCAPPPVQHYDYGLPPVPHCDCELQPVPQCDCEPPPVPHCDCDCAPPPTPQCTPPPAPPPSCPDQWTQRGDSCYLIPPSQSSWIAAHHGCAQLDARARLASVHRDNVGHVRDLVEAAPGSVLRVWLGMVRVSVSPDVLVWIDGSPIDFSNWSPGEPNNAFGGTEHCVHLYGKLQPANVRHKWNDNACSDSAIHSLCQIKLTSD